MKSNNAAYKGAVQVKLARPDAPEQPPHNYAVPVNMVKDGNWAVTAFGVYDQIAGPVKILGADFYGPGPVGRWENHLQCEPNCPPVPYQALDYPCPRDTPCLSGLYPPPLSVSDFQCEIAPVDDATRSVTCGIAANQAYYMGTIKVNFSDGSNDSQQVTVEQPYISGTLTYWGVAGVAIDNTREVANVEFVADSPVANWTPDSTTPYPPTGGKKQLSGWQQFWCKVLHVACTAK